MANQISIKKSELFEDCFMLIIIIAQWDVAVEGFIVGTREMTTYDNNIGHFQEQTTINQAVFLEQATGG